MSMLDIPATFGEVAKNEWQKALEEWVKFGSHTYESFNEMLIDGERRHEPVVIDDMLHPERYAKLSDNQKYWTNRWGGEMNYRYWTDRAKSEMTNEGVQARQLFYEGTIAYKSGDPATAVEKFRDGLAIWEKLLAHHLDYRNDDLNRKDTGLVVKRYLRSLKQLGEPEPERYPFKDLPKDDNAEDTPDPFDATEMLGPSTKGAKDGKGAKKPERPQATAPK
jgi:hypothetical protein